MNKIKLEIWGRIFELDVYLREYKDNERVALQNTALKNFLESPEMVETAKNAVCKYILENYSDKIPDGKIENIFRYVIPHTLFIPSRPPKEIAALLCNFKFDNEHGLAIVFENGELIDLGPEDIIL